MAEAKNEPMKIRAQLRGEWTEIRMRVPHPMETGLRRDAADKPIPAQFIQQLTVEAAGRQVVEAQLGPAVATNPVLAFRVAGLRPGDKVVVSWRDNQGAGGNESALVSAT